ncbi:MAG: response regulator, partial [Chloroflexi bacterium]|nr:response regulator [Chloroflexota bacterium]
MSQQLDTILIVDDDPGTRTLLREQVFSSDTYRVFEAKDAPDALLMLRQNRPDLIVLDLQLPGLSGHDLLVAVQSQGYRGPLIAMAENTSPRSVIEAFRLGATDYVTRPLREAEVMAAVERGLADVRLRRERNTLVTRLQSTNQQLEVRVKQLMTLYEIGQSVTALSDMESMFSRALEAALTLSGADHAMLFLRDDKNGQLILWAGKNLPL